MKPFEIFDMLISFNGNNYATPILSYTEEGGFKENKTKYHDATLIYSLFKDDINKEMFVLMRVDQGWVVSDLNTEQCLSNKSELMSFCKLNKCVNFDRYDTCEKKRGPEHCIIFLNIEDAIIAFKKYWNWKVKWV
jgi:hypothetical protein